MPIGGIIGGLGSAIGGLFGASSADKAAKQQSDAINRAIDLQQQQFQQTSQNMLPFLNAGDTALNDLLNTLIPSQAPQNLNLLDPISSLVGPAPTPNAPGANFQSSPGYNYQLQQMMNGIQNSAAGRTGAVSGNMLRSLQANAGGLANQDFWNWYNALNNSYLQKYGDMSNMRNQAISLISNLASGGQNAAANLGTTGVQAVGNIANSLGALGSAQAAGILGSANALSNGFGGLLSSVGNLFSGPNSSNNGLNFLLGGNMSGASSSDLASLGADLPNMSPADLAAANFALSGPGSF